MKNQKFSRELRKKLMAEEIVLPESLSAENMQRVINEKGGILEPKRKKSLEKAKVFRIAASAAAVFVCIVAIAAILHVTTGEISVEKQDQIITEKTAHSDYSKIESVVLKYYQGIYNQSRTQNSGFSFSNLFGATKDSSANTTGSAGSSELAADMASIDDAAYSTTNVQVDGVEEGDIIKNDGRYLYFLHGNTVTITDCAEPDNMKKTAEIQLFEDELLNSQEMYLYQNTLTVIVNKSVDSSVMNGVAAVPEAALYCGVGYFDTIIKIYDISDKANPELLYSQLVRGNFVSSRLIGGMLVSVSNYSIPYSYVGGKDFDDLCEAVKQNAVPEYSVNGGEMQKIASDRIEILDEENPQSYVVTSVLDLSDLTKAPKMNAALSNGYEIYCTNENLFLAATEYNYNGKSLKDDNGNEFFTVTHIYQYEITDEGVFYKASATVGGSWLNQFSMDQYGDYFRIATTGLSGKGTSFSMVYVLDGDLTIRGYLGDIAQDEEIYAARFMGETLYLVTFYQTDPLFVIDLSDPENPVIQGELKLPGFSSYLHPIGDGLVIGVGTGGTDSGTDGSAKISIFDVSNPSEPKELDNYTAPDAAFDTNHKAIVTVDSDTFGFVLRSSLYDQQYNYHETLQVLLLDISDQGITVQGSYEAMNSENSDFIANCRGAFIGDTVFAVDDVGIVAYSMTSQEKLGELKF